MFRCSATSRAWFANNVLFSQPSRFSEYLLECPSPEVRVTPCHVSHITWHVLSVTRVTRDHPQVRQAVSKLIVFTAHFAASDPPSPVPACLSNIPVEVSRSLLYCYFL